MGLNVSELRVRCPKCEKVQTLVEVATTTEDDEIVWGCPNGDCPPESTHPFKFTETTMANEEKVKCPKCDTIYEFGKVTSTSEINGVFWGCPNSDCPPAEKHPFSRSETIVEDKT